MEIIKQIVEKTGISEDQAKGAVDTVIAYLKGKMPESIGNQLGNVFEGKELSVSDIANERFAELKEDASETFNKLKEDLGKLF
ncbi:MAG: hypothetical protein K1X92_08665 [Bacteroidia bacterium]|nr:hypothetical protein [Bacteroidia bacterium]